MVIYRGPDGKPGYHQTDDIHDAVGFVEQLRNDQGVEHARIFRLEEVGFEYRPYFRVELTGAPSLDAGSSTPAVTAGATATALSSDGAKSAEAAKVVDSMVESSSDTSTAASTSSSSSSDSSTTTSKVAAAADDAASKAESEAPTITSSGSNDNGVGARRGLFGR